MSRIRLPRSTEATATAFSLTAGLLLVVLVVLTVADVFSRNFRDQSILGTVDISTLLLVGVAFLGLASAEVEGQHVSVGMLEVRFGLRVRAFFSIFRAVLLVVMGVLLVYGLGDVLFSAIERRETTNDILRLPTWPAKIVLFVAFLLFFVVAVWREIMEFRAFRSGDVPEISPIETALEQSHSATHHRENGKDA